jgi:hypothetical protein
MHSRYINTKTTLHKILSSLPQINKPAFAWHLSFFYIFKQTLHFITKSILWQRNVSFISLIKLKVRVTAPFFWSQYHMCT